MVDHGVGDAVCATSRGAVHQNRGESDGGAAHQTPRHMFPISVHYGHIYGPPTGDRP